MALERTGWRIVVGSSCEISGCGKPRFKRGWCEAHHARWRRYGIPTAGRTARGVPLQWIKDHAEYQGKDCIKWPFNTNPAGRGNVNIGGVTASASRVMCELVHGEPPTPKHEAAHTCGNGHQGCMNRSHLYWATKSQNQLDRVAQGTALRGEDNPLARLSRLDVLQIREMRNTKKQSEVAAQFGITQAHVSGIQLGKKWGWLLKEQVGA